MISKFNSVFHRYPKQFWLVTVIMLLAWTFHSMLWPYLLIYSSEKLSVSLTAVAGLLTINAAVGLVTTFLGGAIADRFGRKWVMAISLLLCAVSWYCFQYAGNYGLFVALMALNGATTPLYRLAADSMMADLVPADRRIEAYSILRMGNNIGVALGPSIGGFIATVSYSLSFKIIGLGMLGCGILTMAFSNETIPQKIQGENRSRNPLNGYGKLLKDGPFLALIAAYSLNRIASSTIWLMLGAYVKTNYGISERLYGFIPTTNAVMVILFQVLITRWVKKNDPKWMLVLGSAIYGAALLLVAFGRGFWVFWLCMVIATIGEMIAVPTSTTIAASMAPVQMRARYMSIYTLTTGIGTGVGPLLGGFLSDTCGPKATWYGGGLIGFASAAAFLYNMKRQDSKIKST